VEYNSDVTVYLILSSWKSRKMTSKTDSPPAYEDALHHPKSGNDPYQPQHGAPLPPPPSYSPSPGMCHGPPGYWGHGGVYPQASMNPGPGFCPTGMPIPTLSAGMSASNPGLEDFSEALINHSIIIIILSPGYYKFIVSLC